jgi:GT2 family glycosyltransferase
LVILNWNGLEDTLRCLDSLAAAQTSFAKIDIVVIDNGSSADPADEILKKTPAADYLRLQRNLGFAAGSNIGAKRALARGSNFILFLNNDTVIEPNLFEELLANFSANPAIGIVSPIICDMSDRPQIDYAGGRINFAFGEFKHRHQKPATTIPFETDYISGCCMMISKAAVDRIGLFDEKLFAYFEDVDLCLRAHLAGFKLVCVPTVAIRHKGSASSRRNLREGTTSPLQHYLLARNRLIVENRYASGPSKWFHKLVSNPLRILYYVTGFMVRGRWTKLRWFLRGIKDGMGQKLDMPNDLLSGA